MCPTQIRNLTRRFLKERATHIVEADINNFDDTSFLLLEAFVKQWHHYPYYPRRNVFCRHGQSWLGRWGGDESMKKVALTRLRLW